MFQAIQNEGCIPSWRFVRACETQARAAAPAPHSRLVRQSGMHLKTKGAALHPKLLSIYSLFIKNLLESLQPEMIIDS